MAGSVIQPTGKVEFEEAPGTLVEATSILWSTSIPPGCVGWSLVGCGLHKNPISDQILCSTRIIGIKLKPLCGVRIKVA